jgi:hypothetical protein
MSIHETKGGDKFLRTHITETTPWSREAYRPPANPLPGDRVGRFMTISAALLGILGLLGIVTFLSK